jgi:hypothetical protein
VCFDGDASFPLQIHGIEELILLLSHGDGFRELEEAI